MIRADPAREAEIAGLHEIETTEDEEAELFFVAMRPAEYTWSCSNPEEKGFAGKFSST